MIRQGLEYSESDMHPVLVVGNGLSAMISAKTLVDLGLSVTMVKIGSEKSRLYCPSCGSDFHDYLGWVSKSMDRVEVYEFPTLPEIRRQGCYFYADFGSGQGDLYGCLFLAPGTELLPLATSLPQGVQPLSSERFSGAARGIGFLLDYGCGSPPAAGMAAIVQAIENKAAGGESYVIFQHAPVAHLFGESLYDQAKRAGVQFFRFGEKLPLVKRISGDDDGGKFEISLSDDIERGEEVILSCDKILAAQGPDPASVPAALSEILENDLDAEGFLLSDSIHCHSGRSFINGIFAVGEVTGETDLVRVAAQAASAAVKARAWMIRASQRKDEETISVADECVRCLTCYRICPHSAIALARGAARSNVQISAPICQECGICASECPRFALDLNSYPEQKVAAFLAEMNKTSSASVVIYGCQRSAGRAVSEIDLPPEVLFFPVPCAGRISESILWATLAAGAAGVLAIGCHHGNCASQTGTDWAKARVQSFVSGPDAFNGFANKMGYATIAANEPARLNRIIKEFCSSLDTEHPGKHSPAENANELLRSKS